MSEKNVRRAAVSALRAWSKGHTYIEALVERHASRNRLSTSDRGLLNNILLTTLRHRRLLDHWIGMLRKGRLDHETRDVLRVGICQLLLLGIPDHAAVNETVACARSPVRGLINAVLRRAVAARKTLFAEQDKLAPAVNHSHPDWLYKRWNKQFGKTDTIALLEWNNQPAPTYLRANPLSPQRFQDHLSEAADRITDSEVTGFWELTGPLPESWLDQGMIYVQDPSTRHSVELLAPKPGESVLDACAAPGGKATHLAALMQNEGSILCTDSNEKRLPRLEENLSRLHVSIAKVQVHDWTHPSPSEWREAFDAILLDVPCSNTGVLRRRVDARWRLQAEQISQLVSLQRRIAENALPCLKPGGRLVYSTCSIDPAENEEQIAALLELSPTLELESSSQSLPFRDGFDGAYAALLRARA